MPSGARAGLYELVRLPDEIERARAARAPPARGAWVWRGSPASLQPTEDRPGVLLGFGNLSEPAIEQGVRLIAEALAEVSAAR